MHTPHAHAHSSLCGQMLFFFLFNEKGLKLLMDKILVCEAELQWDIQMDNFPLAFFCSLHHSF